MNSSRVLQPQVPSQAQLNMTPSQLPQSYPTHTHGPQNVFTDSSNSSQLLTSNAPINAVAPKNGIRYLLALYMRVSILTTESDSKTFESQFQRMIEAADLRYGKGNYEYVVYSDDGVSGGLGDRITKTQKRIRPGFAQLKNEIESGRFDALFVYAIDRLARNVEVFCDFIHQVVLPSNTAFVSATQTVDITNAMGRAMAQMMAVFASLYREAGCERVKDAMRTRLSQGFPLGPPPYGWMRSNTLITPPGSTLARRGFEPDEEAKQIVLEIVERYLAGHHLKTIAADLNARGVPGPCRNPTYRNRLSVDGAWNMDAICRVLTNPFHAGLIPTGPLHDPNRRLIPGIHYDHCFYDITVYERIMERRRARMRSRTNAGKANNQHLLNGKARCHRCGHRLSLCFGAKDAVTGEYPYKFHRCQQGVSRGKPSCQEVAVRSELIQRAVIQALQSYAGEPEMREVLREEADLALSSEKQDQLQELESLQRHIKQLEQDGSGLIRSLSRELISEDEFCKEKSALAEQLASARGHLQTLESTMSRKIDREQRLTQVETALDNLEQNWGQLSFDEQRELIDLLVEDLSVDRHERDVTLYLKLALRPLQEIHLIVDTMRLQGRKPSGVASLTPRQLAILFHHRNGLSGAQTAKAMGISIGCLFAARTGIRKRLGIQDLSEAADLAKERITSLESTLPLGPDVHQANVSTPPLLSPKLLDVLRPLVEGATPAEVARELDLSIPTVCARKQSILERLEVSTVREAGQKARALGLLN